ncbi:hypothetical protein GCM10009665_07860 [Kitasatospora nipponensis]|uniref:Uncharacterized protein n=1 Tax=Kitasatospora nipponensis TaxID=258049 RepID=A0ABP4GBR0_9ACTN
MSQRRSYPNSGDFNLDDLFRPEPAPAEQQHPAGPGPAAPPAAGQEYPAGPAAGAPWGEQGAGYPQQGPPAAPAPDTQYLPPYPTSDPGAAQGAGAPGFPGQQQPSYGGQQSFGGQTFGGQQSFAGQQQPGQQQPSYGGQQSFESQQSFDGQPAYGGQTFGGQQSYAPAGGGYPGGPYGGQAQGTEQTAMLGRATGAGAGSARPSRRLLIGGVVAACAVGGILVGVLLSGGGGEAKAKHPVAKGSEKASSSPAGSAGASAGALGPDAMAQAQALSNLLGTANASRQAVIGAVGSIQKCDKLPDAQTALTQASAQRKQLLTSLAALKVDKLGTGQQLVDQLNQAWQASASADDAYAAWAGDAVQGCDPAKQQENAHRQAGDQASGSASTAKKQASTLWNGIAQQAGLPALSESQL